MGIDWVVVPVRRQGVKGNATPGMKESTLKVAGNLFAWVDDRRSYVAGAILGSVSV